jgi:hypothetical protein
MPGDAGQTTAARPAAVAVHDYRDVRREPGRIDSLREMPIFFPWLERFQ